MDIISQLYQEKMAAAESGDIEASKWLIQEFIATVKNNRDSSGNPIVKPSGAHTEFYEPLLDYFATRFSEILDGVRPDLALGLTNGETGRGKLKDKHGRDTTIVVAVLEELQANPGMTKNEAKKRVARKLGEGKATVDKAWGNDFAQTAASLIAKLSKGD